MRLVNIIDIIEALVFVLFVLFVLFVFDRRHWEIRIHCPSATMKPIRSAFESAQASSSGICSLQLARQPRHIGESNHREDSVAIGAVVGGVIFDDFDDVVASLIFSMAFGVCDVQYLGQVTYFSAINGML
jgi:hypothetical protein